MVIGVLALQGAVEEHLRALRACGATAVPVKRKEELGSLTGLVIPGGESTAIGKLMVKYGLDQAIHERVSVGLSILGTCTGMILLAKEVVDSDQFTLGLMDITVQRNAYGRQVDSCEHSVPIDGLGGEPFPTVFIRAPKIIRHSADVNVMATWDGDPILVRQGGFMAASFHPELTGDLRIHKYFIEEAVK